LKVRVAGPDGRRITVLKLDENDPENRETWNLIQELRRTDGEEIDLGALVNAMKEKRGLANTVGRQRIMIVAVIAIAVALFGMMLGTSVIGISLMKETEIQKGHVLTAGDGYVVEASEAVQDVPLHYLPFMDVHLLASTIGKSIMYTRDGDIVYEIVRKVSKNETAHEAHVHTMSASIIVNPEGAQLLVDGQKTQLCCADITCSKVSLTLEEDFEALMQKALGTREARRLQARRLEACPSNCGTRVPEAASCKSQSPYTTWEGFTSSHGNSCFKPGVKAGNGDWECPDGCIKNPTGGACGCMWCVDGVQQSEPCRTPATLTQTFDGCQKDCKKIRSATKCVESKCSQGKCRWCPGNNGETITGIQGSCRNIDDNCR